MILKVYVTDAEIDRGQRDNPCSNPVALALENEGIQAPSVSCSTMTWKNAEGENEIRLTPQSVVRFLRLFNNGVTARPFEFSVEVNPEDLINP